MKILIDIGHPAHVHLFKNFAWQMEEKGHEVLFTVREKEQEVFLLNHYKLEYIKIGKHKKTGLGKLYGILKFEFRIFLISLKFKPDFYLSHGSFYAAHISWLLRKPHVTFEDTFNFEQIRLYKPFVSVILTSKYNHPNIGPKNIKYQGYQELTYLHPNVFKADVNIRLQLGLDKSEKYVIMRFVSWNASHDIGHNGVNIENKIRAVKEFSKYAKIFISSESELPKELESYKFPLSPEKMHDAIASSSLVFGESATMVSEGAVLGVPGIYLDNTGRLYTLEQEEKYQLVYNYSESLKDQEEAINMGLALLSNPGIKDEWNEKRKKMLSEQIDVTAFLVRFIRNFPESYNNMKLDSK